MSDGDKTIAGGCNRPAIVKRVHAGGWTKARRTRFLAHLSTTCNVMASAKAAGMSVGGAYQLRQRDAEFRALWRNALLDGYDHLEARLLEHALGAINEIEPTGADSAADAPFDAKLALDMLSRHRANREGRERVGSKRPKPSEEEVNAKLAKQLAALARQLRNRA